MKVLDLFLHLFTPHPSNNHRAKILHSSSITLTIVFLIIFQISLSAFARIEPGILGYASNINAADLLNDTNKKRSENGLTALTLNDQLNNAAAGKASDMFANQYWAHVSPSGKTPWDFITGAGYSYIFAGENLARDFGDSQAVVDAWMNSPSHRDNLLNARFKEVGYAVVNGKYGNDETTLVVQMFGAPASSTPTVSAPTTVPPSIPPKVEPTVPIKTSPPEPTVSKETTPAPVQATTSTQASPAATLPPENSHPQPVVQILTQKNAPPLKPKIDILAASRTVSSSLIIVFLFALALDSFLVRKNKIVRLSSHNFAHLLILTAILIALNMLSRGLIL